MQEYRKELYEYKGLKIGDLFKFSAKNVSTRIRPIINNEGIITSITEIHKNTSHDGFILDDTYILIGFKIQEVRYTQKGYKKIENTARGETYDCLLKDGSIDLNNQFE